MQSWNAGHRRFSADLDQGLAHLVERFARRGTRRRGIDDPYGIPAETHTPSPLSTGAQASLRGLAASLATVLLWAVVLMVATPAPGLAASREASVATCACTVLLPLA